jgi:hypothetical protein
MLAENIITQNKASGNVAMSYVTISRIALLEK